MKSKVVKTTVVQEFFVEVPVSPSEMFPAAAFAAAHKSFPEVPVHAEVVFHEASAEFSWTSVTVEFVSE